VAFPRAKASPAARGYDYAHQLARKRLLPHAYGTPCVRCGHLMQRGQRLHLDHNDQRTGYLGFSHARCNLRAAAREGNRRSRRKTQAMPTSRAW
jgi:hypothetical protein